MKQIKIGDKMFDAYSLLMRKENALQILSGKKTIETRIDSNKYFKMFLDANQVEENKKLIKEGRESECKEALRDDIWVIHFYSTGSDWTLDVTFDEMGYYPMTQESVNRIKEMYPFSDFDDIEDTYYGIPVDERPWFFWFHIDAIVGHKGLL